MRLKSLGDNARLELIRMLAPTPLGRLRNLWIGLSCVHVSTRKFVDTSILVHLREFKVTWADAYTVETAQPGAGVPGVALPGKAVAPTPPESAAPPKRPAHYLWAVLIARIYEVFPLLCPICGGQMRIIAFITHSVDVRHILNHIGVASEPPHITPARGPPLWDDCDAQVDDRVQGEPDWDLAAQPAPDYEVDQRINW